MLDYLLIFAGVAGTLVLGAILGLKWPRGALLGGSLLLLTASFLNIPGDAELRGLLDNRFRWIVRVLGGLGTIAGVFAFIRPPRSPEEEQADAAAGGGPAGASPTPPREGQPTKTEPRA
ncbi:MAG: hypothetical protein HYZ53_12965 [Planctomycetes bacterium]|nr:hypothetical protein [Planctomycetota bacterium]